MTVSLPRQLRARACSPVSGSPTAPLRRLLRCELGGILRRPRTWVFLGVLALVPLVISIGVTASGAQGAPPTGPGPGLIAAATANGLGLPIASLAVALTLLLPLGVTVTAADALAGEAAHGTLRALLLAPVSRPRLVLVKAAGVLMVAALAVAVIALVGVVLGTLVIGDGDHLLTLSGSTVGPGEALRRIGVASAWTLLQLAAVGAVALAVSSVTDRPLVVISVVLGGVIVCDVLTSVPSFGALRPWLLPAGWPTLADLLREPIPTEDLTHSSVLAGTYLVLGLAGAGVGTLRREG